MRTGDRLKTANEIAHETEQIGHGVMADLTTQRETLLRTQDKVKLAFENLFESISESFQLNEGNENIKAGSKTLRLMYNRYDSTFEDNTKKKEIFISYFRLILNKVLLVTIIIVELGILGLVIYLKFFSKK